MLEGNIWAERPAWQKLAKCHGLTDLFFPDPGGPVTDHQRETARICATCPVRVLCDEYAEQNQEANGIWAGKLYEPTSRRNRRRRSSRQAYG